MGNVFTVPIEIRFRDLDANGHVNNAVFFTYFEEGRKAFFFEGAELSEGAHFPFILAHVSCDYRKAIKLGSKVLLQMWVSEIGRKSFTIAYRITDRSDDSIIYADGESIQVGFDYAENRSIEVPAQFKEKLVYYMS